MFKKNQLSAVLVLLAVLGSLETAECADDAVKLKYFESNVRPLLVKRCYKCHSSGKKVQGGFQFGSRESLLKGGESGDVVVPGDVDKSLLISAVRYDLLEMPPDGQLKANEIKVLEKWVKDGAFWPLKDKATREVQKITDADREWWSFQPVKNPAVPKAGAGWARNAIDHFVARKLDAAKLAPAPEADRRTLIRRLYYDLIGLPPTFEQVEEFVSDQSDDAYEKVVESLLQSPAYGERWGRHWLDLVRYSESDGYRKDDYRPDLWRYRDYVIRSFNDDKPYPQFVAEQIAGDEIDPDNPDARVATAFWRLYLYEYNQRDVRTHWTAILDELTDVTGEVFLGMGLGCAKCHDHKFDPLLRKDYFRLQAYFSSMLPQDKLPIAPRNQIDAHHKRLANWEAKTQAIRDEIDQLMAAQRKVKWSSAVEKFPPDIRVIAKSPASEWSPLDRQLMDLVERQVYFEYSQIKLKPDQQKRHDELQKQLAGFDSIKPKPLPVGLTVTDTGGAPAQTFIPGSKQDVLPGQLSVLNPKPASVKANTNETTGRRTSLADWLTDSKNPLTSRVITNRIWQYHFGTGLVETASDFGRLGELPSHPELLDWLTTQFLKRGSSFKEMHRLIVSSSTYRVTATHPDLERAKVVDPLNRLRWRWELRRLDAEQIRDSMLQASGELQRNVGGSPVSATVPRRSIYTKIIRNTPDPFLSSFDATDGFNSTAKRGVTTTPTQSLLMINGKWSQARADKLAARIDQSFAATERSETRYEYAVQAAWKLAFGRSAKASEVAGGVEYLKAAESFENKVQSPLAQFKGTNSKAAAFRDKQQPHQWVLSNTAKLPTKDFTVEAVIQVNELYKDASVRTIVSQWSGNSKKVGWNFGVTSEKSGYKPRNLILQLIGAVDGQAVKYEVVASNLRPELNRPYYVAVVVDIDNQTPSGTVFYLKDLSDPKSKLQTAAVKHTVKGDYFPKERLVIGGRDVSSHHRWNGLIDNVRISRAALTSKELLIAGGQGRDVVAEWKFDNEENPGADASVSQLDLKSPKNNSRPTRSGIARQALVDLSHVLLNSNEFLYVD
jgi:hypothetical protein